MEIFPSHQSFLGFSWPFKGKTRYFCFRVIPFGLSSAPYIFTKLVRPLVSHWKSQNIGSLFTLTIGWARPRRNHLPWLMAILSCRIWFTQGLFLILKSPSGFPPLSWIGRGLPLIFFRGCFLFQGVKLSRFFPIL